nr:hypothetical protein [Bacillus pumilus]
MVVTTPEPTSIMDAYSAIKHLAIHQFEQSVQIIVNLCKTPSEGSETYRKLAGVVTSFLHRKLVFAGAVPDDVLRFLKQWLNKFHFISSDLTQG